MTTPLAAHMLHARSTHAVAREAGPQIAFYLDFLRAGDRTRTGDPHLGKVISGESGSWAFL